VTRPAPGVPDAWPSVPGDPATLAAVAQRMAGAADGMATAAHGLPLDLPDGWQGVAAAAFLRLIGSQADRLDAAAAAWREASSALAGYAPALAEAQALAARATVLAAMDPHRAAILTARAHESARSCAARAAAAIDGAAGRAPRRPGVLTRLWRAGEDWRAEVGLGADESLESLVGLALRLAPSRALGDPGGFAADARAVAGSAAHDLAHPGDLVKGLLDWDTWTRDPARAVGHLVPDAAAAVASGGSVTAARRSLAALAHGARRQARRGHGSSIGRSPAFGTRSSWNGARTRGRRSDRTPMPRWARIGGR